MDMKLFEHDLYGTIRVVMRENNPWFVAKDICETLGIVNPGDAVGALSADKKDIAICDTPGGSQRLLIVNEAGLYNLIFKSRKPEALAFQDWVCGEVLPSVRRHGTYVTGDLLMELLQDPAKYAAVLNSLAEEKKRAAELARTNEVLRDAYWNNAKQIAFANSWNLTGRAITIEEMARVIRQQTGGPGEQKLFKWMRKQGWLCKSAKHKTQPTQQAIDRGLLRIIRHEYNYPSHGHRFYWRTYVTPKGQRKLLDTFLDNRLC